jgi:hypothetical protein
VNSKRPTAGKKQPEREPALPRIPPAPPCDLQRASRKVVVWRMRSAKRLIKAIFAAKDPVAVGARLLEGDGDATAGKIYALFFEYLFGKPAQQFEGRGPEGQRAFQFVTLAPRPNHPVDPNSEDQINKEACRQALTRAVRAARTNSANVTQEDEND